MRTRMFYLLLMVVSLLSCTSCEKGELPTVETLGATFWADRDSIVVIGRVTSDGGDNIVSRGVYLSKSPDPIGGMKVEYSGVYTNAIFKGKFGGLTPNATYYARAYAINGEGIGYGSIYEVTTTAQAVVVAKEATAIDLESNELNSSFATLNGSINPNNLSTEVWIEYGLSSSTTTKVPVGTFEGSDDIQISINLNGLANGEVYYFAVRAKNSAGEVSSNQMSFETFGLMDIDGNRYHTVKIGNQVWLKENLATTRFNDGTSISEKTENKDWRSTGAKEPAYCWYNNNINIGKQYGALYNWYAITNPKIAPIGWHVPTNEEYQELINLLGGWLVAGGKMKKTSGWNAPNTGATNTSKFSALPSGCRDTFDSEVFGELSFYWLGEGALLWTTNQANNSQGEAVYMAYNGIFAETGAAVLKTNGLSIRLIKD